MSKPTPTPSGTMRAIGVPTVLLERAQASVQSIVREILESRIRAGLDLPADEPARIAEMVGNRSRRMLAVLIVDARAAEAEPPSAVEPSDHDDD